MLWIKLHFHLTPVTERQLQQISARQMDRRMRAHKQRLKRRLYGRIKTDSRNVRAAGFVEVDLVSSRTTRRVALGMAHTSRIANLKDRLD